ncbi:uncharacterized protein [Dysidea avara]|uniref:uncharacterized protein isoform X2 n=1 Tax=Dysidea avara TaxID=196820 RepID=UPI0033247366
MVQCVVCGCTNRTDPRPGSNQDENISFHRIPAVHDRKGKKDFELRKLRRDGFLAAIHRADLDMDDLQKYRICSKHFVFGQPADLYKQTRPNWLPTLHLRHKRSNTESVSTAAVERYERARERDQRRLVNQEMEKVLPTIMANEIDVIIIEEVKLIVTEQIEIAYQYFKAKEDNDCECSSKVALLEKELADSKEAIKSLTEQLQQMNEKHSRGPFTEESLLDASDDAISSYSALPNFKVLKAIFDHVHKTLPSDGITKLSPFQEFMFVILKLRINPPLEFMAYQFRISTATASRIFMKWLKQMDLRLQDLIIRPDRDALQKTMPMCFQASFGKKVAVIIDCFEIFIDRPSNLSACASTWSNYKHHNTAKVLLGIAPQGIVSFVSECWGGRVSDKHLTEQCGILKKLLPGDVVLADRGFDIAESVAMMQAQLHIPAFTKGKQQLSAMEVESTRKIANVRIHVERVIGCVRQKYSILRGIIPSDYVTKRLGEEIPAIDRIVRVCCALNNVCASVVPFE